MARLPMATSGEVFDVGQQKKGDQAGSRRREGPSAMPPGPPQRTDVSNAEVRGSCRGRLGAAVRRVT